MVKTKEQILEQLKTAVGDNQSDEILTFIEDVTDTFDNLLESSTQDWKTKYEENDAAWRQKYKDRFFNSSTDEPPEEDDEEEKPLKYENLFKEEK